jgi:DNA polymerase
VADRRRQYLDAMGIQLWQRRTVAQPAQQPQPAESQSSALPSPPAQSPEQPQQTPEPRNQGGFLAELPQPVATMPEQTSILPVTDERAARIAAMDWNALNNAVDQCTACKLHASRTRAVFGVGNRQADWMIIGEAPGADEDRLGEPFVGRAGKLLDLMLQALALKRDDIFIANILKSRPPNNRDPAAEEVQACWPYLARQIELVKPKIILAMGRVAAQNLLERTDPVGRLRGRVHRFGPQGIPLIVTYHPAYLLRSPSEKRKSWDDLQLAQSTLADL